MDRIDLLARLEAATINWRGGVAERAPSAAQETHERLLAMVGGGEVSAKARRPLGPSDLRGLIAELRRISLHEMKHASSALRSLAETGCRFQNEQEDFSGERHLVSLGIDQIPYLEPARSVLDMGVSLAELPNAHQARIVVYLDAAAELRHLEVRQQLELADGSPEGKIQRALNVAAARSPFVRAEQALPSPARAWLSAHQEAAHSLGWSHLSLPIFSSSPSNHKQLLAAAEALSQLSDCLIMPLRLAPDASARSRRRWLDLWRVCEQAASTLSVAAAWLRCLGSTGEYRRCEVCFRHVGEGMKKHCALHRRTARSRIPSREHHVSHIYGDAWRHSAHSDPGVGPLLDDPSISPEELHHMQRAARNERLPPEIANASAALAALLRTLFPLLGPRLQTHVKRHFDACVAEALASRKRTRNDATSLIGPPGRALKVLSWERFFGGLFGSIMPSDAATAFAAGKPIDLDHPLTSTMRTISTQKLVLDLLHLNVWISVDTAFDAYGYLDANAVLRDVGAALRESGTRPTYGELASQHRTTAQAVQQALTRKAANPRRRRILRQGSRELRLLFLKPAGASDLSLTSPPCDADTHS